MHHLLENYYHLLEKIDHHCRNVIQAYSESIFCRKGCADCCRNVSLFPVEAYAMRYALGKLPKNEFEHIRRKARWVENEAICPLLENDVCLLYAHRPVICRTHGYPILVTYDNRKVLDYCRKNFNENMTFRGHLVLDLDQLNTLLWAINEVFVPKFYTESSAPERISISDVPMIPKDDSISMM